MLITMYLRKDVLSTLRQFGDINVVTDRVLHEVFANGLFNPDFVGVLERSTADIRVDINVTEPSYLQWREGTGKTSPRSSLSRLLTYFVDNELYLQLDWSFIPQPSTEADVKRAVCWSKCVKELSRLANMSNRRQQDSILRALELLQELQTGRGITAEEAEE